MKLQVRNIYTYLIYILCFVWLFRSHIARIVHTCDKPTDFAGVAPVGNVSHVAEISVCQPRYTERFHNFHMNHHGPCC